VLRQSLERKRAFRVQNPYPELLPVQLGADGFEFIGEGLVDGVASAGPGEGDPRDAATRPGSS
jgi:hypothetical protein